MKRQAPPITASRPQMRPKAPVLSNAADTSRDSQKQIMQPPNPFANPYGPKNVSAPSNSQFRSNSANLASNAKELQVRHGGHKAYSVHNGTDTPADHMAAVGYDAKATKSTNPIISGYPMSNNARRVGGGNQPSAKRRK